MKRKLIIPAFAGRLGRDHVCVPGGAWYDRMRR
jgi:hypothetical protein